MKNTRDHLYMEDFLFKKITYKVDYKFKNFILKKCEILGIYVRYNIIIAMYSIYYNNTIIIVIIIIKNNERFLISIIIFIS